MGGTASRIEDAAIVLEARLWRKKALREGKEITLHQELCFALLGKEEVHEADDVETTNMWSVMKETLMAAPQKLFSSSTEQRAEIDAADTAVVVTDIETLCLEEKHTKRDIDVALIRKLILLGADVSKKDERTGWAPVHIASYSGKTDALALLINASASVNSTNEDCNTPLHIAAGKGHMEVAKLLIEKRAAVDATNKWQFTPLHISAAEGHSDIARFLVAFGGASCRIRNALDQTPAEMAKYAEIQEYLDAVAEAQIEEASTAFSTRELIFL